MLLFAFRYNWFLMRSHETVLWYLYFRKAILTFLWALDRVAIVEVESLILLPHLLLLAFQVAHSY